MRKEGHEVFLVAPEYPYGADIPPSDDDKYVIRVPSFPVPGDHEDRIMYSTQITALLQKALRHLNTFDLVYIYTVGVAHFEGVKTARSLRVPTIMTWHTHFEEYLPHYVNIMPGDLTRFLTKKATTVQCNGVDVLVAPSNVMRLELKQRYAVTSPVYVVPTGIDTQHFARGRGNGLRFRQKFAIKSDRPVLLFAGRVAFEKNIGFLIRMLAEVVKQVPDILLVIAGDGQAHPFHLKQAQSLGLAGNVLFVGVLNHDDELLDCYCGSDVFVFASRTETQGLVILEAMAMGLPVVSTAQLGTIDTLGHGYSVIVEENEKEFASQTVQLLRDESRRQAMAKAGAENVRANWTVSQTTQQLLRVCEKVVSQQREKGKLFLDEQTTWDWLWWHIWEVILVRIIVPVYTFSERVVGFVHAWGCFLIAILQMNSKAKLKSELDISSAISNANPLRS